MKKSYFRKIKLSAEYYKTIFEIFFFVAVIIWKKVYSCMEFAWPFSYVKITMIFFS